MSMSGDDSRLSPRDHRQLTIKGMPFYAWLGLVLLVISETGMLMKLEPYWTWHTPLAWTGYIFFVDGIIYKKRGSSWLSTNRREFFFLAFVSIPLWVVFEGYNLLIRNWHYVNLPENPIVRYLGYAWAFATISPGIVQTAELVAVLRGSNRGLARPSARGADPKRFVSVEITTADYVCLVVGIAMLLLPVIWPSPYLAAPVFLGFIFLIDPINAWAGDESLVADARRGSYERLKNLLIAGFVCGGLWEFWNFWARAKWIYTVPILGDIKIFEMPVLGYFGFPPFALECFAMYVLARRMFWRRTGRPIGV
jgi:hypothetical protein